jgi:hypothetical protein
VLISKAQFLPEPHKSQTGRMIQDYAGLRYELATQARKPKYEITQEGILLSEQCRIRFKEKVWRQVKS